MQIKLLRTLVGSAALAGVLAVASPSVAHGQLGFVAQASYGLDYEALGIGGGINFPIGAMTDNYGIRLETTFDYFFTGDETFDNETVSTKAYEINGNLLYDMRSVQNLYLGVGIGYAKKDYNFQGTLANVDVTDGDEIGVNVLAGFKLGAARAAPFVQARYNVGGTDQVYLTAGFRF